MRWSLAVKRFAGFAPLLLALALVGLSWAGMDQSVQRVKVDGQLYEVDEVPDLKKNIKHDIEVVVVRTKRQTNFEL